MSIVRYAYIIFCLLAITSCNNAGTNGSSIAKNNAVLSKANILPIIFSSDERPIDDLRDDIDALMCGGYIVGDEVCKKNKKFFNDRIGFDPSKIGDSLNISSVKFLSLKYDSSINFPIGNLKTTTSGLVIIPKIGSSYIPYNKVKGIVLYFHPTAFDKSSVPSMNYYDNKSKQDLLYAALYAAQGYIVVAPDYIGQGIDYKNIHPYVLYPRENVENAVQLLNSAYPLIKEYTKMPSEEERLNITSIGYSEGAGYSSYWYGCMVGITNPCINYLNEGYLPISSIAIDGAYDLANTVYPFLTESVSGADGKNKYNINTVGITDLVKPGLAMLSMMSYMHYDLGYNKSESYISGFNDNFYKMNCTYPLKESSCLVNNKHQDFLSALQESKVDDISFLQAIFNSAMEKALARGGKAYVYPAEFFGGNSVYSLVESNLIDSPRLIQRMKDNTIGERVSLSPLLFISLEKDSVVSPNNTDLAYEVRKKDIMHVGDFMIPVSEVKFNNELITVKPFIKSSESTSLDHIQGENFLNIIALDFLQHCALGGPVCKYKF